MAALAGNVGAYWEGLHPYSAGGGSALQEFEKAYEVVILDVFRDIASAKVSSYLYMDYLHLVKIDGRWQILDGLHKVRQGEQNFP